MIATSLARLDVELIRNNRWGRLKAPVVIATGITGYDVFVDQPTLRFHLMPDGYLWVDAETEWNFGSGPTVNTPEMVRASLPHDLFCIMTDRGLVPWPVRGRADKLFRSHIKELSPARPWYNPLRYWYQVRYVGVWAYSNGVARWKAEPYKGTNL